MGNNLVRSLKGKARSNVLFSLFRFLGVTNVNIKQIENQMKFAQKAKKLVPAKAIFFTDYELQCMVFEYHLHNRI